MGFKAFAKIFYKPLALITIVLVIADIFLLNYQYFDLLVNYQDGRKYLNVFHGFILLFYLYWCTSEFTNEYIISLLVSSFVVFDQNLIELAVDTNSLAGEDNPPWTQHFFFFSVFATPTFLKAVIHNDLTIIQLILIGILLLALSSLSIFSLYTTLIPQSLVICTLVSKFIHIDSIKSYQFLKKILLVAFYSLLFLIICESAYPAFANWILMLQDNENCNIIIKYLTGFEFNLFPIKTVNYSNDLNYFERIGDFFIDKNELLKIVIVVYILSSIFFQKIKQYYENCFVIISILILFIPNYADPNYSKYEINFFVFKTYILIAFAISLSAMSFKKWCFILVVIVFIYFFIQLNESKDDLIDLFKDIISL